MTMAAASSCDPRGFLASLFDTAVRAADPREGIRRHLPAPPQGGRTVVIGAGKGVAQMAAALEALWEGPLSGLVVSRYGYGCPTRTIEVVEAAHPVPDMAGMLAAARLKQTMADLTEQDLVIALICGGGSSLLPAPPEGFNLRDEILLNERLLASGAPISAMNAVRKHFSTIKGGRLAALTRARVVSLIVSDIPGDNPAFVASGPTVPDGTTRHDALDVIARYRLDLPTSMLDHFKAPDVAAPDPTDAAFARNEHHVVVSARISLEAAAALALDSGVTPYILSDAIEGEARDAALVHAAIARETAARDRPFRKPALLLSGGETTVTLRAAGGRGGRNGEFALAMAMAIDGLNVTGLAADTDGIDGTENNAGAFFDGSSVRRLQSAGLDCGALLAQHASYKGFEAIGDLFVTGPTGTNVNDFRAILISDGCHSV